MRQPPRIVIFGPFGLGNFGNDAAFEAGLRWARATFPDSTISAVCVSPALARERFDLDAAALQVFPNFMPRWLDALLLRQPSLWLNWLASLRALRGCNLFLVAGAGVIHDYRDRPWGWPSRFLRWIVAARLTGARVLLLCAGAGPVLNPISRVMMKWIAQLSTRRCYRDEKSRAFMERLGVRDSDSSVMADLAFLLPSPPRTSVVGSKVTVGLNIMNYHGWRRSDPPSIYASYLDNMARFVEWLASKGHAARIVLGQNPSDLFAVEDVERRLGYSLMTAEERQMGSFEEVMGALASTDIVVASRYHVQIAAVKVRRPVLSITYGPMNDALMQAVGLQDFIHHIERIDFARLTSQCDALLDQRIRYSSIVDANVTAIETNLPEQLHRFIFPFQRPEPSAGLPA